MKAVLIEKDKNYIICINDYLELKTQNKTIAYKIYRKIKKIKKGNKNAKFN